MTALLKPGYDVVVRRALLGLQFRDLATGRVVADGLQVDIQDLWRPLRRQALVAGPSGIFALHAFAGLRGDENDDVVSPAEPGRFRVRVNDKLGRYVSTCLRPPLPAGLWAPGAADSPPGAWPQVPLYSAATRLPPVGMCSVYAQLRVAGDDDRPLAWARLELWSGAERLAEGLADEAGRVLMLLPLPRPRAPSLRASPAAAGTPWDWSVTLRAFHDPALAADEVPDLDDVHAQPEAELLAGASPPLPLPPQTLRAGEPLVVRSAPSSYLYVAE